MNVDCIIDNFSNGYASSREFMLKIGTFRSTGLRRPLHSRVAMCIAMVNYDTLFLYAHTHTNGNVAMYYLLLWCITVLALILVSSFQDL